MDLLNSDSTFMKILDKLEIIFVASVCWLLCCLPIITIGASTTALYYSVRKGLAGEGHPSQNFFSSFKQNLKQGILAELIILVIAYILYMDIQFSNTMDGLWSVGLGMLFMVLAVFGIAMICYMFPILARFDCTLWTLFKNSFLICVANFHFTLLIVLINAVPLILAYYNINIFLRLLPIVILLGPGAIAMGCTLIFNHIFKKYIPEDETEVDNSWHYQ